MNRKNIGIMVFALLVVWIGLIFYFSSQPSKSSYMQSNGVIKVIKHIDDLFDITDTRIYRSTEIFVKEKLFNSRYKSTSAVVRKSAHFGIYFILGMMCSAFGYLYTNKLFMTLLLGTSLPIAVAVLDEFNQGFVGRTSSLSDVILDGTGALMGTIIAIFIILITRLIVKKE